MCSIENCKHSVFIDDKCKYHTKQKCAVCFEDVKSTNTQNSKVLSCNHSFHPECITTWFTTSDLCPTCRKPQTKDPLIIFKTKVEDNIREKYKDAIESLEEELAMYKSVPFIIEIINQMHN